MEARSALDHELLGTTPDGSTEPTDTPVVSTPPQTASTSTAVVVSVYSRLGPPEEESEFSVFTTANPRSVEAPALWCRDQVAKKACTVDDRRVVKDAGSFGDSTLTRFFPLGKEDETLLKVLEIDAEVIEYLRSTYKPDWDPAKPFGHKSNTATKEAERFAKQVESTSALLARLSIYLQRTQVFISATILNREKERAALLAELPPPPMPECMVDETLAGAVSLANFLTAAIGCNGLAKSSRLVLTVESVFFWQLWQRVSGWCR